MTLIEMIKLSFVTVILGYIIDLIVGDPKKIPHPVQAIGLLIFGLEWITRKIFPKTRKGERIAGGITAILVQTVTLFITGYLLYLCSSVKVCIYGFNLAKVLFILLSTIMSAQVLATNSLKTQSMAVYSELKNNDIKKAREKLSMIVGRDVENLDEEGIIKADIETIAENTSDGVIAPLLCLLIGGAPLGMLYKATNTLDSMIGYKNEKYKNFGTVGAKLDDVWNFLPSRISAILMIISSEIIGYNSQNAMKIWKRDRRNHESPNSAQTESVMAGALEIQLAGDAVYGGKIKRKKTIGDDNKKIDSEDIVKANKLLYATSISALIIFGAVISCILILV